MKIGEGTIHANPGKVLDCACVVGVECDTLRSNRGAWTVNNEKQVGGPVNCSESELCTFLQALGEGYLPTYYSDTSQSAQSKSISIASRSYQRDKKTVAFHGFPSLQMSRNLTESRGAELLTWCLADSLARTSPPLARAPGSTANVLACGQKWLELSVRFDRDSCSWKTHRLLFDADLPESSVTLPVWGRMTADGVVLERTTVPLHTSARDAGLSECWPTPVASDGKTGFMGADRRGRGQVNLNTEVRLRAMFPTPRASDADRGGRGDLLAVVRGRPNKHTGRMWPTPTVCGEYNRKGVSKTSGTGLATAVREAHKRMWPTPRAEEGGPDFAKAERGKRTGQSVSPSLATAVALEDGPGLGPLNPTFREWLMGWPIDWSARRPLATDKFQEWLRWHGRFSPRVCHKTQKQEAL